MLYQHKTLDFRLYIKCGETPEGTIMVYDLYHQTTDVIPPDTIEPIEEDYPGVLMEIFDEFIDNLPKKIIPKIAFNNNEQEDEKEEQICIQLGKYLPKEERVWDINFKSAEELGLKPEDCRKLLARYEAAVNLLTSLLSHCENFPYKDDTNDKSKYEGDYYSNEEEADKNEEVPEIADFEI